MGIPTDIEELKGANEEHKAARRKSLQRLAWAACTALVSIVGTTSTLSWKMRGYVDELEQQNLNLRGDLVTLGQKLERVSGELEAVKKDAADAVKLSDKALFLAQLSVANNPQRKP